MTAPSSPSTAPILPERGRVKEAMKVRLDRDEGAGSEEAAPVALLFRDVHAPPPSRGLPLLHHSHEAARLRGASFQVRRGEVVALLCDTADLKESIPALLSRHLAPTRGEIHLTPTAHLLQVLDAFHRYCDLQDRLLAVDAGLHAPGIPGLHAFLLDLEAAGDAVPEAAPREVRRLRREAEGFLATVEGVLATAEAEAAAACAAVRPLLQEAWVQADDPHADYLRGYVRARRDLTLALAAIEARAREKLEALLGTFAFHLWSRTPDEDAAARTKLEAALRESLQVRAWTSLLDDADLASLRDHLRAAAKEVAHHQRPVTRAAVEDRLAGLRSKYSLPHLPKGDALGHELWKIQPLRAEHDHLKLRHTLRHDLAHIAKATHGAVKDEEAHLVRLLLSSGFEAPTPTLLDRRVRDLTPTDQARAALAACLAAAPGLLLVDAAAAAPDPAARAALLTALRGAAAERRLGVLLLTTDPAEALGAADRIAILHQGRVVEEGPAATLGDAPAHPYTRARLGAPGDLPPAALPPRHGCAHRTACANATDRCAALAPLPATLPGDHRAECHHASPPPAAAAAAPPVESAPVPQP